MSESGIKVSHIQKNLFFTWAFKYLRETKSPKLCELTQELQIDENLKQLQSFWKEEKSKSKPSFTRALFKVIWKDYLIASIIQILGNINALFISVILKKMIDYLTEGSKNETNCNLMIAGLILVSLVSILLKGNSEYRLLI